jgi:TolA-binding protein
VATGSDTGSGATMVQPGVGSGAGSGSGSGAGSGDTSMALGSDGDKPKNPNTKPKNNAVVHHVVAAAEDKDPKALIKQAKAAEAQGDWDAVRGANQKLEKIKGYTGPAVYGQAWAAFQMNDTPAALALSQRAIKLPGPQRGKAMMLMADTIFKQGDYKRAKDNYLNIRALVGKDQKSVVMKKIALCNKQLGLPERDGVKD